MIIFTVAKYLHYSLLSCALALPVYAATSSKNPTAYDLLALYRLAKVHDPRLQAAYHQQRADLQALPQAVGMFLPNLSANAVSTRNKELPTKSSNPEDPYGSYVTWNYQLTLSQPLFRFGDWANLAQARYKEKAAMASLEDAEQDLLLRLSNQYFAILQAENEVNFAKCAVDTLQEQLVQVKQRFEVGLVATTDLQEVVSRHDAAYSKHIIVMNTLANEQEKMREIIGVVVHKLARCKTGIVFPTPFPNNIEQWVDMALIQNWQLQSLRHQSKANQENISRAQADHLPSVTMDANYMRMRAAPPYSDQKGLRGKSSAKNIGLRLNLPLFAGGTSFFRAEEARANYERILAGLEAQTRTVVSGTRQAFRNVMNDLSKMQAFEQLVSSSKISLEATQAAFEVGTRTMVDVLNARQGVLDAEQELHKAHYDYITDSLTLKKFSGILGINDLISINAWLDVNNSTSEPTVNTEEQRNSKIAFTQANKKSNKTTPQQHVATAHPAPAPAAAPLAPATSAVSPAISNTMIPLSPNAVLEETARGYQQARHPAATAEHNAGLQTKQQHQALPAPITAPKPTVYQGQ
jgi:outer membrane protein